jgi:hypothetical protein
LVTKYVLLGDQPKTPMSYDIYFIKRTDLTLENIDPILESEVSKTDKHFISKQLMIELTNQLRQQDLEFEVFDESDEDHMELNFPTYQVSMFNSQVALSVPYWDINSGDGINQEIKMITNTLLDNGFTGYDPQTGAFIVSKFEFGKNFTETKTSVDAVLSRQTEDINFSYKYVGIGVAVVIIALIIWTIIL